MLTNAAESHEFYKHLARPCAHGRMQLQEHLAGDIIPDAVLCPCLRTRTEAADTACPQLVWMNHVIKTMWPHIGKVVFKQAVEQAKPILADICTKVFHYILHIMPVPVLMVIVVLTAASPA